MELRDGFVATGDAIEEEAREKECVGAAAEARGVGLFVYC